MTAHLLQLVRSTPVVGDIEDIRAETRELADLMQRLVATHPKEVQHMLRYARRVLLKASPTAVDDSELL